MQRLGRNHQVEKRENTGRWDRHRLTCCPKRQPRVHLDVYPRCLFGYLVSYVRCEGPRTSDRFEDSLADWRSKRPRCPRQRPCGPPTGSSAAHQTRDILAMAQQHQRRHHDRQADIWTRQTQYRGGRRQDDRRANRSQRNDPGQREHDERTPLAQSVPAAARPQAIFPATPTLPCRPQSAGTRNI